MLAVGSGRLGHCCQQGEIGQDEVKGGEVAPGWDLFVKSGIFIGRSESMSLCIQYVWGTILGRGNHRFMYVSGAIEV